MTKPKSPSRKRAAAPVAAPQLTPEQIEALQDHLCRNSFESFLVVGHKEIFGATFEMMPHHRQIIAFLEDLYYGREHRGTLVMPPRAGKSRILQLFLAWCQGRHPASNWIVASYSQDLADRFGGELQEIFTHPFYQRLFPYVSISKKSGSKSDFTIDNAKGASGHYRLVGVGGGVTGYPAGSLRPDKSAGYELDRPDNMIGATAGGVIVDDLVKVGEGDSDVQKKIAWNFCGQSLLSRLENELCPFIVCQQRVAVDDPVGHILDGGMPDNVNHPWKHVTVKALQTDEQGNEYSYWPARISAETLKDMREKDPSLFFGQMQAAPVPASGSMFDTSHLREVAVYPELRKGAQVVRAWDIAATRSGDARGKRADWTVGTKMSIGVDGSFTILDIYRARLGPEEVEAKLLSFARSDGKDCVIAIEEQGGAAGKMLRRSFVQLLAGYDVRSIPAGNASKADRARPFAAQLNAGRVTVYKGPHVAVFKHELSVFPNGGTIVHDDTVDAAVIAFSIIALNADMTERDYAEAQAREKTARAFDALAASPFDPLASAEQGKPVTREESGRAPLAQLGGPPKPEVMTETGIAVVHAEGLADLKRIRAFPGWDAHVVNGALQLIGPSQTASVPPRVCAIAGSPERAQKVVAYLLSTTAAQVNTDNDPRGGPPSRAQQRAMVTHLTGMPQNDAEGRMGSFGFSASSAAGWSPFTRLMIAGRWKAPLQ